MSQPKKRPTKTQWEMAIRKARQYTSDYSRARWLIAKLALEVCDYSHGGRKGESIYSVRKFADEIDLERKTLYQWIRVKRLVYDKLPKGVQTKAHDFLWSDFDAVSDVVTEESPPAEVRRRWTEQLAQPVESKKFAKYIAHLNAIFYNVSRPVIMKDVEQHHVETMIEKTAVILALLRKELELRKKYPRERDQSAARLNIKSELAKRINQSGEK